MAKKRKFCSKCLNEDFTWNFHEEESEGISEQWMEGICNNCGDSFTFAYKKSILKRRKQGKNSKYIDVDGGLLQYMHPYGQAIGKAVVGGERKELPIEMKDNTNNEAELFAILFGITECLNNKKKLIYSDSQWSIGAITKNWKIKERRLKLLSSMINALLNHYNIKLKWKPREKNLAT